MCLPKSAIKIICLTFLLVFEGQALGHGENKPGPNGGHIRMPGAFHTELVAAGDKKSFKVFLLDLTFQNPVVQKSSVKLEYAGAANFQAVCTASKDFFDCKFKDPVPVDRGAIRVLANRQGMKGGVAEYNLPLKFP